MYMYIVVGQPFRAGQCSIQLCVDDQLKYVCPLSD